MSYYPHLANKTIMNSPYMREVMGKKGGVPVTPTNTLAFGGGNGGYGMTGQYGMGGAAGYGATAGAGYGAGNGYGSANGSGYGSTNGASAGGNGAGYGYAQRSQGGHGGKSNGANANQGARMSNGDSAKARKRANANAQKANARAGMLNGRIVYGDRKSAKDAAKNPMTKKEYDKYARLKRKEKDYFYVMNKGVCFFMFLLAAVIIAVMAVGFVGVESLSEYTALYVKPDNTTKEARLEVEDYQDASEYIQISDSVYGFIGGIKAGSTEEEAEAYSEEETIEEETEQAGTEYLANVENLQKGVNEEDSMSKVAVYVYKYSPIAFVVIALLAFIILVFALLSLSGRRIFKGFAIMSLIILIFALVLIFAGMFVCGNLLGNPSYDADGNLVSVLDFEQFIPFISRVFTGAPTAAVDGEVLATPVPYVAGYGLLILTVAPIVMLILSAFTRRRIPYSVFDK